ncbi:MAG TPA: sulfite exporter TauE/SafE family protein [Candidatus Dormibacteraeota bacterium]|nr:sulfite exporter TauE/SafE family protein [Candidatus Dormibacteraeota bacterium]
MSWLDVAAIVGGLFAGVLSGLVGIGGGQVFVPLMTIGFGASQVVAQGTSLAAIIPTAVVGGYTHVRQKSVDLEAAAWTGGGGVVGAVAGALLAVHVAGPVLARIFGALLIVSSFLMFRRARAASRSASFPPAGRPGEPGGDEPITPT